MSPISKPPTSRARAPRRNTKATKHSPRGPGKNKKPTQKYSAQRAKPKTRPKNPTFSRNAPYARKPKNAAEYKMGGEQVEGRRAVLELLIAGTRRATEIIILEDQKPAPIMIDIETIATAEHIPVRKLTKPKFLEITHTDSPQGVIARARPLRPHNLEDLATNKNTNDLASDEAAPKPLLLVIDGVMDTGNLGNLLRSAECAGVTGIVIGKHRSARITPATAKAASGAIEYLPIALVSSIPAAITDLKNLGVWTLGLDGEAEDPIYDTNIADEPLALVLGAEHSGLSKLTKARVDSLVSIPLKGKIDSLNAATASAIACFEIQRIRQKQVHPHHENPSSKR